MAIVRGDQGDQQARPAQARRAAEAGTPAPASRPGAEPAPRAADRAPKTREHDVPRPEAAPEDAPLDAGLRPQRLDQYTGQAQLKESLAIAIGAARARKEPLDHVLLYGPPGLGKTTLAGIVANEMGGNFRITSAPALERPRDLAGLLVSLQPGDVLFIDEIHRLNRLAEEILYPAMEDFSLDITIGKGQAARIKRLPLPRFTLVGATTRVGALSAPLRDRFGFVHRLGFYDAAELGLIVARAAQLLDVKVTPGAAEEVAARSRGTPRIANRLLKRVRDYAQVRSGGVVTPELAREALDQLAIDPLGLDPLDRQLLRTIAERHGGGPVGLETLAAALGEDESTLADVYEPFLLQQGLLARTPRGRTLTPAAYRHLGLTPPPGAAAQGPLFEP